MNAALKPDFGVRWEPITQLREAFGTQRSVWVTDIGVFEAWKPIFDGISPSQLVILPVGEEHKTWQSTENIFECCQKVGLTRSDPIVAVGGGLVCDVAGFAAATWMRGCQLVLAPTTLLAQVDAAWGGKTAINFGGVKNLVGTFYPAHTIWMSPEVLHTLPQPLLLEGFTELCKHALLADAAFFAQIEATVGCNLTVEGIAQLLPKAVQIKQNIVSQDISEHGLRMLLNLGHTLGHAIEAGFGVRHGLAVALGILAAAKVSVQQSMLPQQEFSRIVQLFENVGLPTSAAQLEIEPDFDLLLQLISHDKKARGKIFNIVLLNRIGEAKIVPVLHRQLQELIYALP